MQYKTIILELLQQRPQLHERLRRSDILLETLNEQAQRLRTRHLEWSAMLVEVMPESETSQITRTAFELALSEWETGLTDDSLPESFEPLTLDAAMAFIRRPLSPE